jgi:putative alpha-1,2-mannosidase
MSSWYVWAALGMYPEIPGRAELLLGSPLFPHALVHGSGGDVTIRAPGASSAMPYVHALRVNGKLHAQPWLAPAFVEHGGKLDFTLAADADTRWGDAASDAPPSFSSSSAPTPRK